jgi:hypothetical protein
MKTSTAYISLASIAALTTIASLLMGWYTAAAISGSILILLLIVCCAAVLQQQLEIVTLLRSQTNALMAFFSHNGVKLERGEREV